MLQINVHVHIVELINLHRKQKAYGGGGVLHINMNRSTLALAKSINKLDIFHSWII